MKTRLNKIVVPTLSIAIGAAIAGSISGTVAWYQYSTRASTAYLGTSVGASGNLQIRIKGENKWVSDLSWGDVETWLYNHDRGQAVQPVTPGGLDKDDALPEHFYRNPVAGKAAYADWLPASEQNYVTLPLEFRYVKRDGNTKEVNNVLVDEECVAEDIYISDLLIQPDWENTKVVNNVANNRKDLSNAIRVHIHSYEEDDNGDPTNELNRLISNQGGTIVTHGELDINGDGDPDEAWNGTGSGAEYGFGENNQKEVIVYGEADSVQTSYSAKEDIVDVEAGQVKYYDADNVEQDEPANILPSVVNYNASNFELTNLTYKDGDNQRQSKKIGTTIAFDPTDPEAEKYLQVELTIWVEGWQKFQEVDDEGNPKVDNQDKPVMSSIWDGGYIDSKFDVGFSFACQAWDSEHTEAKEAVENQQQNNNPDPQQNADPQNP